MSKPPVHAALVWQGDLRFAATSGDVSMTLDGQGAAGPSPMQAVAVGLAGCMAIDVVDIIRKGRHQVTGLEASLTGVRAEEPPRRFTAFTLHYVVSGDVPTAAVERAIQLSREKYCSVWHSLRTDITLETTFEVRP
ncbi:MAG: OsmC family protein [Vicinamibacterales bacterium]